MHSLEESLAIVDAFLATEWSGEERHQRRIDILSEYEAASDGHMVVRFVSPDTDEEREEAEAAGVQQVQHQHIENDSVSVVEGYRGIVFEYLGNRQAIPVVQPDGSVTVVYVNTQDPLRPAIAGFETFDGGRSWGGSSTISDVRRSDRELPVRDPGFPSAAVGADGTIHVACARRA